MGIEATAFAQFHFALLCFALLWCETALVYLSVVYKHDSVDKQYIIAVTRQNAEWADLRGASLLVSFNHVIDPYFVAFSSSLYTTICNLTVTLQ